ncbi:MAG: class I SAM-dependent methyltransferase [Chromatiales bacterium]|nr:class I SAM-dependent methyltransferase [Gammaproteobacteria bacterium]MCP5351705.1 class I SAM-dependent methyltransferase [Chromatiales bacterium]
MTVHRPWALLRALLARGDLGLAESWVAGDWHSDDLTGALDLLAANRERFAAIECAGWPGWPGRLAGRLRHLANRNTRAGSRRNIAAHYDLGNAFYRRWLDAGMTYSAACFDGRHGEEVDDDALLAAQERKYERIMALLDARPGQHILEIGCGWGGFAEYAARWGMRVTGITLSREQLDHARERIAAQGLGDRVALRLTDYRELVTEGVRYDHVVSIEMFEAVGEAWWGHYFDVVRDCLKPGGSAVLQVITIADARFQAYRREPDFIQRYIFPGGMLPGVEAFNRAAYAAGLDITDQEFFGADYARTLAAWHARFRAAEGDIAAIGHDDRFRRLWRYYLAYCEVAFRHGYTDVMHVRLVGSRGEDDAGAAAVRPLLAADSARVMP